MQSRPASGTGWRRAVKEAMTPPWEKPASTMRSGETLGHQLFDQRGDTGR
jgi:hypothetical protein